MKLMALLSLAFAAALVVSPAAAATITIDGHAVAQTIEGFGVNANHRSWHSRELPPVLDRLIDEGGMTLFRVIYDNTDWEASNDDDDPAHFNWPVYDRIYTGPGFTQLWELIAYLNRRGITDGVVLNFMGHGPAWLCSPRPPADQELLAGREAEWAEMIASAVIHARRDRGLKFHYLAPDNEPDIPLEGVRVSGPAQYVTMLRLLAERLDASGQGDVRFLGPDLAKSEPFYREAMVGDPRVMAKLGPWATHGYSPGGGSAGMLDFIHASAYPDRTFWQTEFNVWCTTCDSGTRGTYDWSYCRGTAEYLLGHLANDAAACLVWEGYDSYYDHHAAWGFWGLFAVDDENAATKTYTPRKNFYTFAQVSRFVRPGAQRVRISGDVAPFSHLLTFKHAASGRVVIVGVNPTAAPVSLDATLADLPPVAKLDLVVTTASANLTPAGSFPVAGRRVRAMIPADCVFTLSGSAEPEAPAAPRR